LSAENAGKQQEPAKMTLKLDWHVFRLALPARGKFSGLNFSLN